MSMMTWLDGHYLLALDGTGFFSLEKINADFCLQKRKRNGAIEYHLQILAGVLLISLGMYQQRIAPPNLIGPEFLCLEHGGNNRYNDEEAIQLN